MQYLSLFLTLVSGIAWTIVYISCIRTGFKQKTYCMPLFALGLNFAWEVIYSADEVIGIIGNPSLFSVQTIVNIIWASLDAVIVYTYFKYGKKYFPETAKKYFVPFSILTFATCVVLQLAYFFEFKGIPAAQYSAFVQNAAMSILFLIMLYRRGSTEGQTLTIAVAKWIGTLAPALLMGVVQGFNIYIVLTGIVCSVFDLIYIVALSNWKKQEKAIR